MARFRAAVKRVFDIGVAAALIALTAPLWGLAAVAILAQDGGPVFFRHTRVGRGGRRFGMWKFRSMVRDAATRGGYQTVRGDPRITPVGRLLRRTSIDELPQLLNVVCGDMSLVGPRPDTPAQEANYATEDWALRCTVRPGITGLAQVAAKTSATPQDRAALDLRYVREQSLALDLRIMGRTAMAVLRLKNR
ncbi:MAG: sugar transferase [Pseudomonadota bacterium]